VRLVCLASDDNGETWYDYAISEEKFSGLYAVGGHRKLTPDQKIIGSFTVAQHEPPQAWFFKIQAGIARARIELTELSPDKVKLTFNEIRGFPKRIRFKKESSTNNNDWGQWLDFKETMELSYQPTHFQLNSSLGVESPAYKIN